MGVLTYKRDTPVKASELDKVFTKLDDELGAEFSRIQEELDGLKSEIKRLNRDLEAERRLRLAMKR